MSSARNHAKRSHRSEHFKRASIGASAHRAAISRSVKTKRVGFFERLARMFRRNKEA